VSQLNKNQISQYVSRSLMLVTALSPIGYDKASAVAHDADRTGCTLGESVLDSGYISAADFDRIANPATMVGPF
jgi:fumarate hydratase, class II